MQSGTSTGYTDTFSPAALAEVLRRLPEARRLLVAFSGGLDSSVLLHALVQLGQQPLLAVHVHHGLQPEAGQWQQHCREICLGLGVELHCETLSPPAGLGNLESWARQQRYQRLQQHMQAGDAVLSGHHQDDQAETLLLRLLRGAGVRGLAAMQHSRRLGPGLLLRPLLGFSRASLERWALQQGLEWIEDPSNHSSALDRNFLRHQVLPVLGQRWPAVHRVLCRDAAHLQQADELLADLAQIDYQRVQAGAGLSVQGLQTLSRSRASNLLAWWLRQQHCPPPSMGVQQRIFADLLGSREDACPQIHWGAVGLRRYRDQLLLVPRLPRFDAKLSLEWRPPEVLNLPHGRLSVDRSAGPIDPRRLPERITVAFRQGGERCRLPGRPCRPLKKLLQEAAIPVWERERIPLLFDREALFAIADRWVCEGYQRSDGTGVAIVWESSQQGDAHL